MISLPAIAGGSSEIFVPNPLFSTTQGSNEDDEPVIGDAEDALRTF
jgi:hypothetical protein